MSKKSLYLDNNFSKISFYDNNFHSANNSYIKTFNNKTELGINNSFAQPTTSHYHLNHTPTNKNTSMNKTTISYSNNYVNDRYAKVVDENADLKKKLFELEKSYKLQKGEMEEKILFLRDENSNLQLQIQKIIEKQKNAYKNSENINNENKVLINNINILENDKNALKDNITRKNADIEEKNKIITDLLNEKNLIMNEDKMLKIQINNLLKDKEILIRQIQELKNNEWIFYDREKKRKFKLGSNNFKIK